MRIARRRHGVVPMRFDGLHAGGDSVPGRADRSDVYEGREQLSLRCLDEDVHRARVVRRGVPRGGMRPHVQQHMHPRTSDLRCRGPRDVHAGDERLLGLWRGRRVRSSPGLHRCCRLGFVQVQDRSGLHHGGERLRERVHPGELRAGRAGVLLRSDVVGMHKWSVQCRSVLHERVHGRGQRLLDDQQHSVVHGRSQRVHGGDPVGLRLGARLRTIWIAGVRRPQLGGVAGGR